MLPDIVWSTDPGANFVEKLLALWINVASLEIKPDVVKDCIDAYDVLIMMSNHSDAAGEPESAATPLVDARDTGDILASESALLLHPAQASPHLHTSSEAVAKKFGIRMDSLSLIIRTLKRSEGAQNEESNTDLSVSEFCTRLIKLFEVEAPDGDKNDHAYLHAVVGMIVNKSETANKHAFLADQLRQTFAINNPIVSASHNVSWKTLTRSNAVTKSCNQLAQTLMDHRLTPAQPLAIVEMFLDGAANEGNAETHHTQQKFADAVALYHLERLPLETLRNILHHVLCECWKVYTRTLEYEKKNLLTELHFKSPEMLNFILFAAMLKDDKNPPKTLTVQEIDERVTEYLNDPDTWNKLFHVWESTISEFVTHAKHNSVNAMLHQLCTPKNMRVTPVFDTLTHQICVGKLSPQLRLTCKTFELASIGIAMTNPFESIALGRIEAEQGWGAVNVTTYVSSISADQWSSCSVTWVSTLGSSLQTSLKLIYNDSSEDLPMVLTFICASLAMEWRQLMDENCVVEVGPAMVNTSVVGEHYLVCTFPVRVNREICYVAVSASEPPALAESRHTRYPTAVLSRLPQACNLNELACLYDLNFDIKGAGMPHRRASALGPMQTNALAYGVLVLTASFGAFQVLSTNYSKGDVFIDCELRTLYGTALLQKDSVWKFPSAAQSLAYINGYACSPEDLLTQCLIIQNNELCAERPFVFESNLMCECKLFGVSVRIADSDLVVKRVKEACNLFDDVIVFANQGCVHVTQSSEALLRDIALTNECALNLDQPSEDIVLKLPVAFKMTDQQIVRCLLRLFGVVGVAYGMFNDGSKLGQFDHILGKFLHGDPVQDNVATISGMRPCGMKFKDKKVFDANGEMHSSREGTFLPDIFPTGSTGHVSISNVQGFPIAMIFNRDKEDTSLEVNRLDGRIATCALGATVGFLKHSALVLGLDVVVNTIVSQADQIEPSLKSLLNDPALAKKHSFVGMALVASSESSLAKKVLGHFLPYENLAVALAAYPCPLGAIILGDKLGHRLCGGGGLMQQQTLMLAYPLQQLYQGVALGLTQTLQAIHKLAENDGLKTLLQDDAQGVPHLEEILRRHNASSQQQQTRIQRLRLLRLLHQLYGTCYPKDWWDEITQRYRKSFVQDNPSEQDSVDKPSSGETVRKKAQATTLFTFFAGCSKPRAASFPRWFKSTLEARFLQAITTHMPTFYDSDCGAALYWCHLRGAGINKDNTPLNRVLSDRGDDAASEDDAANCTYVLLELLLQMSALANATTIVPQTQPTHMAKPLPEKPTILSAPKWPWHRLHTGQSVAVELPRDSDMGDDFHVISVTDNTLPIVQVSNQTHALQVPIAFVHPFDDHVHKSPFSSPFSWLKVLLIRLLNAKVVVWDELTVWEKHLVAESSTERMNENQIDRVWCLASFVGRMTDLCGCHAVVSGDYKANSCKYVRLRQAPKSCVAAILNGQNQASGQGHMVTTQSLSDNLTPVELERLAKLGFNGNAGASTFLQPSRELTPFWRPATWFPRPAQSYLSHSYDRRHGEFVSLSVADALKSHVHGHSIKCRMVDELLLQKVLSSDLMRDADSAISKQMKIDRSAQELQALTG